MSTQSRKLDFTGQTIHVGIDTHLKSWRYSIHLDSFLQKTINLSPPSVSSLVGYLRQHYPGGSYVCAYEAGFTGFWIQRGLAAQGIETLVVNAADVPTTDKERQQKDDVRDSRKIARALRNGELVGIYVPDEQAEQDRAIVRNRESIVCDRKRAMNRIKSYLHYRGMYPPCGVMEEWKWDRAFISWLHGKSKTDKNLELLMSAFEAQRKLEKAAMAQIRILFKEQRHVSSLTILRTVPGVGFLSATKILTELIDIKRFGTFDQLCFYAGLIPGTDSSGEHERAAKRTIRGNKRLRTTLIECAWAAIHYDTELALAYSELKKRMNGQRAIIKIARKLLNRIRYVWLNQTPYLAAQ